jgi:hypothetical protein
MRWRLVLGLGVVGVGLIVWGVMEWYLGRGSSAKPERISLKQLIARGPEGNPNIILTDFELGDNFVYKTENNVWKEVYVPAFPTGEANRGGAPGRPAAPIKAIIFSINVHSEIEINTMLAKPEMPALVTNRIKSLGSEEKRLLQNQYGAGIDVNNCLIIQEGRKPFSGWLLALIFGGGVLLLVGAVGVAVSGFMGSRQESAPRPRRKRRREEEEDEEDERPRKKRRRVEEDEDEDERPRKRRRFEEDEDRPRRRSRDEDD